ncbi:universal stress protein [Parafilimonas sp.]|uniref:universal stress protein n=1 Tax=Parafilimonas sp. TaxID=1969739 RepID=UPI0039E4AC41
MNTIIAPTDFTAVSLNAVHYAADMAAALKLNLLVLHATEAEILSFSTDDFNETETSIDRKFIRLKDKLVKRTGNTIKIRFKAVPGIIENEVIKICDRRQPFAVVMATHGANAKTQFFMESITIHLSRHLNYPVIIVPPDTQYRPVQKIVLATDLKDIDKLPAEKITTAVNAFNARLHILHINNDKQYDESAAEAITLKARLEHLNPVFHFLKCRNVQRGILMYAENNEVDMIITFPKKHLFFHKSETKQVIFNSPVTVMTIR